MESNAKKIEDLEKKRQQLNRKLALAKRSMILNERKVDAHMKICIGVTILELMKAKNLKATTADYIFQMAQEKAGKNNPAWERLQILREGLTQQTPQTQKPENLSAEDQN